MIHILAGVVVLLRLMNPANAFPIIEDQETGISETKNASVPNKVYSSSMFEHWIRPGSRATSWNYNDPAAWASIAGSSCGGRQQSPIDIVPKSSVTRAFPTFRFHNYGNFDKMKIMNNGHTVVYSLPTNIPKEGIPYVTDGGLNGIYEFHSFHLHWGSDSTRGSEHLINSKSYPAELHLVHYNTKYGTFADATTHSDGLAVLGIFLMVGSADNKYFQPLVDRLDQVVKEDDEAELIQLVSFKDLLPRKTTSFFRYSGSLTTPNCNEIVTWTVFELPLKISERQLSKFRSLRSDVDAPIVDNFRPAQQLEGRMIFYRRFTGCDLGQSRPLIATFLWKRFKWAQCLMNFALMWPQSAFAFIG